MGLWLCSDPPLSFAKHTCWETIKRNIINAKICEKVANHHTCIETVLETFQFLDVNDCRFRFLSMDPKKYSSYKYYSKLSRISHQLVITEVLVFGFKIFEGIFSFFFFVVFLLLLFLPQQYSPTGRHGIQIQPNLRSSFIVDIYYIISEPIACGFFQNFICYVTWTIGPDISEFECVCLSRTVFTFANTGPYGEISNRYSYKSLSIYSKPLRNFTSTTQK